MDLAPTYGDGGGTRTDHINKMNDKESVDDSTKNDADVDLRLPTCPPHVRPRPPTCTGTVTSAGTVPVGPVDVLPVSAGRGVNVNVNRHSNINNTNTGDDDDNNNNDDNNVHGNNGNDDTIPEGSSSPSTPVELKCCCGREDCAVLGYNNAALEGLERDLNTAAKLGQALLHRHESYVAGAEEDRRRLVSCVDSLEREKLQIQTENARIVEENRGLLDQLDGLNNAVAESDAHVQSLTLTLESTRSELRKLTVAAGRAAELEVQLDEMEAEQIKLHANLLSAREDERSSVQRWKHAESTLRDLHDQVNMIEKEAREERERHAELVQRMERRRTVERELDGAADRLKGAAAANGLRRNHQAKPTVVSSFVRDILQDNANLQLGIMELREMLESSNREVENLRDQVMYHQPLAVPDAKFEDGAGSGSGRRNLSTATTLSDELQSVESSVDNNKVLREVHIHHHYHKPSSSTAKTLPNRRPKKKRPVLPFLTPAAMRSGSSGAQLPRQPASHCTEGSNSSASTILFQTSASIPPRPDSSLASSPQSSAYRPSSVFDRMDRGFESSQPTSPESTVFPSSPLMRHSRQKRGSSDAVSHPTMLPWSMENYQNYPGNLEDWSLVNQENRANNPHLLHPVIPEESEDSSIPDLTKVNNRGQSDNHPPMESIDGHDDDDDDGQKEGIFNMSSHHSLRKSSSHGSLMSVAGMDIHAPFDRHSRMGDWQANLRLLSPFRAPSQIVSPNVDQLSTPPITSTTTVMADKGSSSFPTISSNTTTSSSSRHSPRSLLASVAANSNLATSSSAVSEGNGTIDRSAMDDNENVNSTSRKTSTLGRRVGGWVRGRWGMVPISATSNAVPDPVPNRRGTPNTNPKTNAIPDRPSTTTQTKSNKDIKNNGTFSSSSSTPIFNFRSPGINQKGPVLGFRPPRPAPISVQPERVDENLLRESLAE